MTGNEPRFRKEIFEDKVYDPGIPDRDNLTVVDIGGHVGLFVEYILPKATLIHTIEPYKPLFDTIVSKYGDNPKVKVHNLAIASKTEERLLNILGGDGGSSIHFGDDQRVAVQAKSLKDFMKDEGITHIDLLKVDCEGGEEEIINTPEFQELAPLIDNIVGEVHSGIDITNSLLTAGYALQVKGGIFAAYKVRDGE